MPNADRIKLKERTTLFRINYANEFKINVVITSNVGLSREIRSSILGPFDWRETKGPAALFCSAGNTGYIFLPISFSVDFIVHESFHCVWYIMEYLGAAHENEIMAYHLGYIVDQIAQFYLKKRKTSPAAKKKSRR